jgi:4a-hydroxytetrahydrobiopterin dehydratase
MAAKKVKIDSPKNPVVDGLLKKYSKPIKPGAVGALSVAEIKRHADVLPGWSLDESGEQPRITKTYKFEDYYETIAFVNALAWVANHEDHHPDLEVGYNKCVVHYSTHSVGGLSENDFICAAKVDALLRL